MNPHWLPPWESGAGSVVGMFRLGGGRSNAAPGSRIGMVRAWASPSLFCAPEPPLAASLSLGAPSPSVAGAQAPVGSEPGGGRVGHTVCATCHKAPGAYGCHGSAGFLSGPVVPKEKELWLLSCSSAKPRRSFAPRGGERRGGAWERVWPSGCLMDHLQPHPPLHCSSAWKSLFWASWPFCWQCRLWAQPMYRLETALLVAWLGCVLTTTTTVVYG